MKVRRIAAGVMMLGVFSSITGVGASARAGSTHGCRSVGSWTTRADNHDLIELSETHTPGSTYFEYPLPTLDPNTALSDTERLVFYATFPAERSRSVLKGNYNVDGNNVGFTLQILPDLSQHPTRSIMLARGVNRPITVALPRSPSGKWVVKVSTDASGKTWGWLRGFRVCGG